MKIYVIGSAKSYAGWMQSELTNDLEKADLVWLTGGEDINPAIYNEPVGSRTHFSKHRDEYELDFLNKAITLKKPIFGTCRGAQLLCAIAGGRLVQHLSHPSHHAIRFWDGTYADTTSCHHQLQYPFSIKNRNDYEVLAWSEGLSQVYLNGNDEQMNLPLDDNNVIKEPELVYYRKLNALGIQGHPEWMGHNTKLVRILRKLTTMMVEGELDVAIRLKIDLDEIMKQDFKISDDSYQLYNSVMKGIERRQTVIEKDTTF